MLSGGTDRDSNVLATGPSHHARELDKAVSGTLVPQKTRSRLANVGMSDAARAQEFKRARRHTFLVRTLRVVFPVSAALLLASYLLAMPVQFDIEGDGETPSGRLTTGPVKVGIDSFVMSNPKFEGFGDDGSRYVITAARAKTPTKRDAPIRLEAITGTLTQADNTVTRLTARRGSLLQKTGALTLADGIEIETTNGLKARLVSALIRQKRGIITSRKPVEIETPTAKVVGQSLRILQKRRTMILRGGVRADLQPPAQPDNGVAASTPADASAQQAGAPAPSGSPAVFGQTSNAPVVVTARTLRVDDADGVLRFARNVVASQEGATLKAGHLVVGYRTEAEKGQAQGQGQGRIVAAPGAGTEVQRITARDNVILSQNGNTISAADAMFRPKEQRGTFSGGVRIASGDNRTATAETATFDQAAQTAQLTGKVVVQQGPNRLRGEELAIDQAKGTLVLSTPGGRIDAAFVRPGAAAAKPAGQPAKTPVNAATAASGTALAGGWSFRSDVNAPINIAAQRLRVDDRAKVARFEGGVNAQQGTFRMSAGTLVARYTGSASVGDPLGAARPSPAAAAPANIREIQALGNVVVESENGQKATGDKAVFNVAENSIALVGNVTLIQGRQQIRGDRVVMNVRTGVTRIETAQTPLAADGTATTQTGRKRMRATFYPKDLQELNRQRKGGAKPEGPQPGTDQGQPSRASSWAPVTGVPSLGSGRVGN